MDQELENIRSRIATMETAYDREVVDRLIRELSEKYTKLADEKFAAIMVRSPIIWYKKWSLRIYDGSIAYGISLGQRDDTGSDKIRWQPYKTFSTQKEVDQYLLENERVFRHYREWRE